jgi:hypothetical protein
MAWVLLDDSQEVCFVAPKGLAQRNIVKPSDFDF